MISPLWILWFPSRNSALLGSYTSGQQLPTTSLQRHELTPGVGGGYLLLASSSKQECTQSAREGAPQLGAGLAAGIGAGSLALSDRDLSSVMKWGQRKWPVPPGQCGHIVPALPESCFDLS